MPTECSRRYRRMLWSMVSKAALRSSNTSMELALLSMVRRMLFTTLVTAVSVEYRVLNPD